MNDWDALRFFLAVQRSGSFAAAAASLKVDATTVGRRIDRLEDDVGGRLFLRGRRSFQLTPRGAALVAAAEDVERTLLAAERSAMGEDDALAGKITLSAVDIVMEEMLPMLQQFREAHPRVELDLVITARPLDLARREADLALRVGKVIDPNLVARRLGRATLCLYASHKYLQRRGRPSGDFVGHDVIVYGGELAQASATIGLTALFRGAQVAVRTNNTSSVLHAVLAGMGIGPVSAQVARDYPELELVRPEPLARRDFFVVGYREVIKSGRVKALWDHLVRSFATHRIA